MRAPSFAFATVLVALAALSPGPAPSAAEADPQPPRLARLVRLSGTVVVEALVDSSGTVRATNVVRSQPLLDDSASVEVARRSFVPERGADGRAVPSLRTIAVPFAAPGGDDLRRPPFVAARCEPFSLRLDPDIRPDSTGALAIRWTAGGPRSHELRLLVLTPDGVTVDTTGSSPPQRLLDTLEPDVPGWPTWTRSGKQLREGAAAGTIGLRLSSPGSWWSARRIALVGLFHDAVGRAWVVRQAVYRIEEDAMGALLVRDAAVEECLAGPFRAD